MTTRANPGYGSKFFLSTDNVHFNPIAQLRTFAPSGSKAATVDQTNVLTPDNFDRPLATRVTSGEIAMEGVLDPANANITQLGQAHAALQLIYGQIVLTDGTQYTFQGYVTEYVPFDVKYNKAIAFSAKIRVSGALSGPAGNA